MGDVNFGTEKDEESYDPAAREAEQKEMAILLSKVNVSALLSRASSLRDGVPCSLTRPLQYDRSARSSVMGGMNYHIEIQFQDGLSWLARIRRLNATSPPPDLRAYIMCSEVATLQFLSKTKIPVPKVFDYNLDEKNPIGVGYILMEKMAGRSLRWSLLSAEQKRKVMSQLADIYIELQRFPFDLMGSLDQPGTERVGFFARESLTDYKNSHMLPMGPFPSSREYLLASIQLTLDLIMREECFSPRAIDAYLVHRFLLDSVSKKIFCPGRADGRFYLRHADNKGDHILIDDEYNITGIVDWEWAHTDVKSAAFNSPVMLLPVADFYDGKNQLGEDEVVFAQLLEDKGHEGLAEIVREGRILHRFEFCHGYDVADWEGFLGIFQGLRKALGVDGDLEWETWREKALSNYRDDDQLKKLLLAGDLSSTYG
ncbi:conserved hypothetical protein [Histoplasma capsulatum G186AR]|uniref:Aminoglycoside phosphotransferase domain-containing protein n=1 Tax=Ajellomyces capsulatus (strain G186AR / H82 / ATCC MYA-2454 / RMSCC 2432) TaxID=447093 RepID=C0NAC0_AJECG|nr:uncharacterized protein HCBG_00066 [Histoplasma capsulatum G186AR]EEH10611.1 conserved hypothetical protein [Histoplasma capsulatum G186AR]